MVHAYQPYMLDSKYLGNKINPDFGYMEALGFLAEENMKPLCQDSFKRVFRRIFTENERKEKEKRKKEKKMIKIRSQTDLNI